MLNNQFYLFIFFLLIIIGVVKEVTAQGELKLIHSFNSDDPCGPYNPPAPNFFIENRRLSTAKCHEYIWLIQRRLERAKRHRYCLTNVQSGVGGRNTYYGEFAHMAAIGWQARNREKRWIFKCSGSLISDKFVLTAAHCIRAVPDSDITDTIPKIVRLGNKNIENNNFHEDIDILNIIPHENYKSPKKYYDIALIELDRQVQFSSDIHPACLLNDSAVQEYGPKVVATGWGVTKLGGAPSDELQAVHLQLMESAECDQLLECHRHWCGLRDHQMCAANSSGGVDTCNGDSGGPLQIELPLPPDINGKAIMQGIVGITSFGFKCGLVNNPGVYTKVSYFLDWIESIVWDSSGLATTSQTLVEAKPICFYK